MRVVYSDEFGTGNVGKEPIMVVCAIMLNLDSQWEPVEHALRLIPPQFKRRELKGGRLLRDVRNKKLGADEALRQILSIPRACHLPIFFGAVSREGFRKAQSMTDTGFTSVLHAAFTHCLERVASYIYTAFPKEKVLWIADGGRERELREELSLAKFATDIISNSSKAGVSQQSTCMVDTVYFGPSEKSLAIQLADVCCFVIGQKLMNNTMILPYYDLIKIQIVNSDALPDFA